MRKQLIVLDESAHDVVLESIQRSWAEVTTLMKQGNADIFPSKERTHEIIQSKLYLSILRKYQPKLRAWLSSFQEIECKHIASSQCARLTLVVPQRARTILMIEYEYMRKRMFLRLKTLILILVVPKAHISTLCHCKPSWSPALARPMQMQHLIQEPIPIKAPTQQVPCFRQNLWICTKTMKLTLQKWWMHQETSYVT